MVDVETLPCGLALDGATIKRVPGSFTFGTSPIGKGSGYACRFPVADVEHKLAGGVAVGQVEIGAEGIHLEIVNAGVIERVAIAYVEVGFVVLVEGDGRVGALEDDALVGTLDCGGRRVGYRHAAEDGILDVFSFLKEQKE